MGLPGGRCGSDVNPSGATQNDHRVDFRQGIEIVPVHIAVGVFQIQPSSEIAMILDLFHCR